MDLSKNCIRGRDININGGTSSGFKTYTEGAVQNCSKRTENNANYLVGARDKYTIDVYNLQGDSGDDRRVDGPASPLLILLYTYIRTTLSLKFPIFPRQNKIIIIIILVITNEKKRGHVTIIIIQYKYAVF